MLKAFADFIVEKVLKLDLHSRLGDSIDFFIYDTLKIILLLSIMIFSISFVRSYFPPERVKQILGKFGGLGAHFMASILGVLSPF
ncbi:uncharacterized membrane protein YraQ (UPF0718 family) [Anaerosolibacter carboniphilus]|uniref:Uncharacterized membrane protein YraQ (UPF0718 family) n=1 Tax=Anaerosolibacter carboniphilus TaxID=1417629 RepID=A0A841L1Q1_9FIRM|nr:uncharacterized membrane protein YraQ (UPF0718 family) [Anaerosolibacter carboniphilus]